MLPPKENKRYFTEITAKPDRCGDTLTCPAVFEVSNSGRLVIIGAKVEEQPISARTGRGEAAIEIDRSLLTRAVGGPLSRLLMRAGL